MNLNSHSLSSSSPLQVFDGFLYFPSDVYMQCTSSSLLLNILEKKEMCRGEVVKGRVKRKEGRRKRF
jgi:hypothetical protein